MGVDDKKKLKILQISNISVSATRDQVFSMCQYIGRIDDIKLYPTDANLTSTTNQRVAFVKFDDERCVEVGQHLTNTVLIDRALVCVPYLHDFIPDETSFLNSGGPAMAGVRQLPPHVSNKFSNDADGHSILLTVDPTLEQLGLPAYPTLPGDTDPAKVEEIRRTIYVGNLPKGVDGQAVADFFNMFGEVMYVRMAQVPDTLPCAYAYVEFSQQTSVPIALQNNGTEFNGRALKIQHSRVAIIKPQQKTTEQAVEEIEEAIRMGKDRKSRSPRRRRSPSPRKRTRSPLVRRRSRSRSRRSRSRDRTKRSRSRDRKRSRSRDRKRSRSRDRRRRSRSRDKRDRSRDRKRSRSKSRDRKKDRKDRKRSRSRSKDRDRKRERRDRTPEKKVDVAEEKIKKENDIPKTKEEENEQALREKLIQTMSAKNGNEPNGSEEKIPSKVKNERKPIDSDSD